MLENEEIRQQISQNLHVFWTALLVSLMTGWVAWKRGFFNWNPSSHQVATKGKDVLKAFFSFIFMQIIFIPALIVVIFTLWKGNTPEMLGLNATMQGWINTVTTLGGVAGVFLVFFRLSKDQRQAIWGDSSRWYNHLIIGALTWLISYPLVLAFNQLLEIVVLFIFQEPQVDQVAVKHFRYMLNEPILFWVTTLTIIGIVPILEELLFRGFLQSWLKTKFKGALTAIVITSIIFAFFHFSVSQGITNIELIASLFLLSCFLGFLYEKQQSLWASIGLHSCFNALSILMIIFE